MREGRALQGGGLSECDHLLQMPRIWTFKQILQRKSAPVHTVDATMIGRTALTPCPACVKFNGEESHNISDPMCPVYRRAINNLMYVMLLAGCQ